MFGGEFENSAGSSRRPMEHTGSKLCFYNVLATSMKFLIDRVLECQYLKISNLTDLEAIGLTSFQAQKLKTTFFTCLILGRKEYWFRVGKNEKENIADIHVLGLFIATKHDLRKKTFRLSRTGTDAVERKICTTTTAQTIRARERKFWLAESFGPT
jgi:hypothetical protein